MTKMNKISQKSTQQIPSEIQHNIISLQNQRLSNNKISLQLKVPHSTVGYVVHKYKETGSVEPGHSTGWPSSWGLDEVYQVNRWIHQDDEVTAGEIAEKFKWQGKIINCC